MTDAGERPEIEQPTFTLCLYRHTDDVATMEQFLRAMGLHRTVFRDQDGCTFLWGRSGMIALFDASSGETPATPGGAQLCFETDDRDLAVARFKDAGVSAVSWDEPPTPAAGVRDPQGAGIWIAESYRDADDEGDDYEHHPVDVVAVRYSKDVARDAEFFALMDFVPRGSQPDQATLVGSEGAGVLRLEPSREIATDTATESSTVGTPALVELGFETEEPLEEVGNRLRAAGFAVDDRADPMGSACTAVDPDGIRVKIWRR